jgi:glycerol-3-phosphate acyltransferase PlsY
MAARIIISVIAGFLLGALPFSFILGKLFRGIDIRKEGSGNPGATNALRVLGKPLGFTTLLLDIGKGWAAVEFAIHAMRINYEWGLVLAGLAAVLGHIFTPFLNFKGGKGVATTFGIFLAFTPMATFATILVFLVTVTLSRYVSLGSILSAICFPIFIYCFNRHPLYIILATVLGIFIIWRHRTNIQRLKNGTESKIFSKK